MNNATQQIVVRNYTATELIERIQKAERVIASGTASACVRSVYQHYRDTLWALLVDKLEAKLSDAAFLFIFEINASFTLNLD